MEDDPWSSSSPWDAPSSSAAPSLPESSASTLITSPKDHLGINEEDGLEIPPSSISNTRRPSADSDPWGGGAGGVWGSSGQQEGAEPESMDDGGWGASLEYQHEDISIPTSDMKDTHISTGVEVNDDDGDEDVYKQADDEPQEPDGKLSSPSPPSSSPQPSSPQQVSSLPISFPASPYPPPVSFSPPTGSEAKPELEFESVDLALNDFSRHTSPLPVDDIPSNTSFDDFGDFGGPSGTVGPDLAIGDDPWAIQAELENEQFASEGAQATSVTTKGWGAPADGDEDDAWGARKTVQDEDEEAEKVDEWEAARRLAERRMARAPPHVISGLIENWSVLARDRYPDPEKKTISEEGEAEKVEKEEPVQTEVDKYLDVRLANMKEITNLLADLTDLPPTITAFSKPLHRTSLTERRFREALTRSSRLSSSTSLLVVPRRLPSLNASYPSPSLTLESASVTGDSWTSRSRLGEPDNTEAPVTEDEQSSRGGLLSFFGRKVSGQNSPGMGKRSTSVSSLASFGTPSSEDASKASSVAPINTSLPASQSNRASLEQTRSPAAPSPNVSKASTPRPSLSARSSSLSLPAITEPSSSGPTTISPSASVEGAPISTENPAAAAPSAVSRFLNRFSRKPAARPTDGPRALELSAGDFDFLAEVEGTESGADLDGDFLGSFGVPDGSSSSIGGLENFLQTKKTKDVPLPAPLAPPPRASGPVRPTSALGSSSSRAPGTQMDELDFFKSQSMEGPSSGTSQSATFVDEWDDFLSNEPVKSVNTPSITPSITPSFTFPKPPSLSIATTLPALTPSSPLVPSRPASASISASTVQSNSLSSQSATPTAVAHSSSSSIQPVSTHDDFADEDGFGDFGEYSQPASGATGAPFQPSSSSFDDFDDFSSFSAASSKPSLPPPPPPPPLSLPTASSQSLLTQSPIKPSRINTLASEDPSPVPINKSPRHQRNESYARSFEALNDRGKAETKPVALPALLPPPPSSLNTVRKTSASFLDDSLFETPNHLAVGHSASIAIPRTSTPSTAPFTTSPVETTRGPEQPPRESSLSGRSVGSMSDLLSKAQEVDVAKGHWTYTGPTSPPVMALPPPPPSMFGSGLKAGADSPGFFSKGDEEKLGGFPVLGGMSTMSSMAGPGVDQGKSKGGLSQADLSFFDGL